MVSVAADIAARVLLVQESATVDWTDDGRMSIDKNTISSRLPVLGRVAARALNLQLQGFIVDVEFLRDADCARLLIVRVPMRDHQRTSVHEVPDGCPIDWTCFRQLVPNPRDPYRATYSTVNCALLLLSNLRVVGSTDYRARELGDMSTSNYL